MSDARKNKVSYQLRDLRGNTATTLIPKHLNDSQILEFLEENFRVLKVNHKHRYANVVVLRDVSSEGYTKVYRTDLNLTKMKRIHKHHNDYKYKRDDVYKSLLG